MKKNKRLQKQINKLDRRVWLLENPRLFNNGEVVKYWPFTATTIEPDSDESFLVAIHHEEGVFCNKTLGKRYYKRTYMVERIDAPDSLGMSVNEINCQKQ